MTTDSYLSNVRPPSWVNPTPKRRYDLVVIGAGTAGLVTAAGAAGLGATVALVERHLMGGDCLNVGCVPSKALLHAARAHAGHRGPRDAADDDRAFAAAMERLRAIRARISLNDGAPRFARLGVDVFFGEARFTGRDTVAVGDARLRFARAAIATGGRPALPDIPGIQASAPHTNETIFDIDRRPASLLVLGGGPIGCELAQAFARFGTSVTLIDRGARLLSRDDEEVGGVIRAALERDGVRVVLNASVARVEIDGVRRRVHVRGGGSDETVELEALLVAAGRQPNVEGLGLDAAGVEAGSHGVVVDDYLRTSNRRIYAAGDVASRRQFTHVADAMARIVVENALFFNRARESRLVVPWCTYTSPEAAHAGVTREDARRTGLATDEIVVPLREIDRARLEGEEDGFLLLHLARGADRILGATLVAPHAGEILSELTLAMTAGLGLGAIARTIHPYPTRAEIVKRAADQWRRGKLTPRTKALIAAWLRVKL